MLVTFASDIGGYVVGSVFGKHPMAPSISPKKSWEGFAGSAVGCVVTGTLCVVLLLDGEWWVGLVLGAVAVVAASLGDLAESLIKRDLGIKDMSNILPGHGGVMDRLDSLLATVSVVWLVLDVPAAGGLSGTLRRSASRSPPRAGRPRPGTGVTWSGSRPVERSQRPPQTVRPVVVERAGDTDRQVAVPGQAERHADCEAMPKSRAFEHGVPAPRQLEAGNRGSRGVQPFGVAEAGRRRRCAVGCPVGDDEALVVGFGVRRRHRLPSGSQGASAQIPTMRGSSATANPVRPPIE